MVMVLSLVGTSVVMMEGTSLVVVIVAEFGEKPMQIHLKLKMAIDAESLV